MKNGGSGDETTYLLDTSAIFALIEDEAGADRVAQLLRNHTVLVPFVVLLEIYYISLQEKGEEEANSRYAMLKALDIVLLTEVTEPVLLRAAQMKAQARISLADAIIAAFAALQGAVLVHKRSGIRRTQGPGSFRSLALQGQEVLICSPATRASRCRPMEWCAASS